MIINISLAFLFILIWSLLLNSSAFYYAIVFIVLVLIITFNLVFSGVLTGVISLVLIVVYIGAIIIIVGYVCSVVPNPKITINLEFNIIVITIASLMFLLFFWFKPISLFMFNSANLNFPFLSEFYYSVMGYHLFIFIVLILLLLLFIVSTSVSVNSTLRGL